MRYSLLLVVSFGLMAADLRVSEFGSAPAGWSSWTPRAEIAPRVFVDSTHNLGGPGALAINGASNPAAFGGWEYLAPAVAGKWYRFAASYRAVGLTHERTQVIARLDWQTAEGRRAGQPDYAGRITRDGEWTRIRAEAPAPENATAVKLQLYLANAPQATIWWDDVELAQIPAPGSRNVAVAAVNLRPKNTGSREESVRQFLALMEKTVPPQTDLVLLPEGMTVVGTGKEHVEVAEPVPGPTTASLAAFARKHNTWVAAGLYEREGQAVYNTAVLIDRKGNLAGRYRKVYLPREEYEGGLSPGLDYPVFDTDFGRVGLMICWDVQYADPARALALRGAEIILLPIWGGNVTLAKARAIENHLFLVSSGFDYPTHIIDPNGEIIAAAASDGSLATATIDLNRRYVDKWLGDMRPRFVKELRLDVPVAP